MNKVQEALNEAFEALLPFADCLQYIEIDEDDEEWAKFRLLIKHYRQAAIAYELCKSALSDIDKCEPVASESHLTKVLKLTALEHAIELSSKHGSGPADLGCFTVLQDMAVEIRNGNLAAPTCEKEKG